MKKFNTTLILLIILPLFTLQYGSEILGETKGPRSVEDLINDLKDESWQVRWSAAETLGEMKDLRAVEALVETLKDKNVYVRGMAARALGEIKDPRAIEPLINALKDEIKDVRRNAAWALKEITGEDFGQDYTKWQDWWKQKK